MDTLSTKLPPLLDLLLVVVNKAFNPMAFWFPEENWIARLDNRPENGYGDYRHRQTYRE
ncbi:MAG: hypothetical protein JNK85_01735 [Verrucomicrobiales bacterium]|nr:hypothetical protein [Verrucomicrobiales bacterium]